MGADKRMGARYPIIRFPSAAARGVITLKRLQWSQGFQRGQRFRGRAEVEALVYELYELTEEEMGVVEGANQSDQGTLC